MRWFTRLPHWQMAVFAFVFVGAGILLVATPSDALVPLEEDVAQLIGAILAFLGWAITQVLLMAVNVLIKVAEYNSFVTSPAVERGWVIVRDLTNMFFIVVMLVIAFGTVLGLEEYSYKRMLPRLLIMAVVINFSKLICGLMIDFSQVVMITFVDGFSAIAAGNFLTLFKVTHFLTPDATSVQAAVNNRSSLWANVASMGLAAIMMLISVAVVAILTLMLVFRIVMLWLLVVMSPLAFFLSAFPKGKAASAYAKWWELFGNYVIVGPFVAFFLWLSLAVAGTGDLAATQGLVSSGTTGANSISLFTSQGGTTPVLISFIIGTAMLLGGMTLASQFGTAGGSMMASTAQWFQQKGRDAITKPLGFAAGTAGSYAKLAEAKIAKSTGVHLPGFGHYTTGWKKGMDKRVATAQADAQKTIQGRIQQGGAMAGVRRFFGDAEGTGEMGFVKNALDSVRLTKPWAYAAGGWENYAGLAEQSRVKAAGLQTKRREAEKNRKQGLTQELESSEMAMADDRLPMAERTAARERAEVLRGSLDKLDRNEELNDDDRKKLADQMLKAPKDSDSQKRIQGALNATVDMEQYDVDIAKEQKLAAKFNDKAIRSRAAGGKVPAEFAKHGLSGAELAGYYNIAKEQKNGDEMVRVVKRAFADGEADELAKNLGVEIGVDVQQNFKNIWNKVGQDAGLAPQQTLAAADEASANNKYKDFNYSNQVVTGAAGVKRWSSEDEFQTARNKDLDKGENFSQAIRKGLTKQVGSKDENGVLQLDAAGAVAMANAANMRKLIDKLDKQQVPALDVAVLKKSFEEIAKQMRKAVPDGDTAALENRLAELRQALNSFEVGDSFSDALTRFRKSMPTAAAPRSGGGGGGGGSAPAPVSGSPAPARPTRPTTVAPPSTPPPSTAPLGGTGGSFGGSSAPPTPPTT